MSSITPTTDGDTRIAPVPTPSRWEWRTFYPGALPSVVRRLVPRDAVSEPENEDVYVLATGSLANVKIRGGRIDIKAVDATERGLERWRPTLKAAFPLGEAELRQACDALAIPFPDPFAGPMTAEAFLRDVVAASSMLTVVHVRKRRTRFTIGGCAAEHTELDVDGARWHTVALEDADPGRLSRALRQLPFSSRPNTSYPAALRAMRALPTAPVMAGLEPDEARRRLAASGRNVAAPIRTSTTLRLVAAQFFSPISSLLLLAAGLSIAVGERTDGSIILGVLGASALLGFWQEHRSATAVRALLDTIGTRVRAVRGGIEVDVPIEEVVPGDVVRVAAGSSVPGDGRLLDAKNLFIDQSALTGESAPAAKTAGARISGDPGRADVFLGTHVVSGTGTILVERTGQATKFGAIARRLVLRPPETAFEHGVRRLGYLLLEITTLLALAIFAINVAVHRPVLEALLFTLALSVGLTPQLLPAIVSVTLSRGAVHLARQKVIVRRLASIEDLGGMQVLCTDKTGTITEGRVAVHGAEDPAGVSSDRVRLLAYLNAAFETGFPNPIDDALRASVPAGADGFAKLDEIPYDFSRKRLSVVVSRGAEDLLLITKGSVSAVLACSTRVDLAGGSRESLDAFRPRIERRFAELGDAGYRCLGIAYRRLERADAITRDDERDLVFAGLLTLADPIKAGAAEALRDLATLGIAVKLVTGDNRRVAARLAREAGLDASRVVCGADIHPMSDDALRVAATGASVFAEMEPHQKERVIMALRTSGLAVGYLGDGINDATALHAADVGISVDTATDVTREAADIVLLDKNLGVLAAGVREGRRAFANTLKYVFITVSANFGNMFSMAGASLLLPFLPLLPKQILLTNVLTDLPAMAIATDDLDPELVNRPRRWDNRAIGRFMLVFGLVSSLFDYCTFALLASLHVPVPAFRTAWFIESVWSELVILLVIRTRRSVFRSQVGRALSWLSLGAALVTVLLPWTPLGQPLGFLPIGVGLLVLTAGLVIAYAGASIVARRAFFRREPTSS